VKEEVQVSNLKHIRNEVSEIKKGMDCGIIFFDFEKFQIGDTIEAYSVQEANANSVNSTIHK